MNITAMVPVEYVEVVKERLAIQSALLEGSIAFPSGTGIIRNVEVQ